MTTTTTAYGRRRGSSKVNMNIDETLNHLGMKRRKDGSSWIVPDKGMRPTAKPAAIPLRTRENVAACEALGLSFWSEHPQPGVLWAVDDHQQAHAVKIDRRRGLSYRYIDGHPDELVRWWPTDSQEVTV